jgi:radical SAM superfamily enzyme with C-terminal helix-hairpin-helix motif
LTEVEEARVGAFAAGQHCSRSEVVRRLLVEAEEIRCCRFPMTTSCSTCSERRRASGAASRKRPSWQAALPFWVYLATGGTDSGANSY